MHGRSDKGHGALADGALLAEHGSTTQFARFFIVLVLAEFFFQTASLQQLLESAQGRAYRFSIVNAHPDGHKTSLAVSLHKLNGRADPEHNWDSSL